MMNDERRARMQDIRKDHLHRESKSSYFDLPEVGYSEEATRRKIDKDWEREHKKGK